MRKTAVCLVGTFILAAAPRTSAKKYDWVREEQQRAVGAAGKTLYLMISGITFPAQCHVTNPRITLCYADGRQVRHDLANPFDISVPLHLHPWSRRLDDRSKLDTMRRTTTIDDNRRSEERFCIGDPPMKVRHFATLFVLLAVSIGTTWSVASGASKKDEADRKETYAPTVEEWLMVWANANFGRNDTRRTIQFIVHPGKKKILMVTAITDNPEAHRTDPALRQKMSMEAKMFEAQVKAYARRFGFELQRSDLADE